MAKRATEPRDGVYRKKGRDGFYGYLVDKQGKPIRRKLDGATTLTQARERLAELKAEIKALCDGKQPLSDETFADFVAGTFLPYQRKRVSPKVVRGKISPTELNRQEGILSLHLLPHFGAMKLSEIRRVHVIQYIHNRTGVVADGTILKEVTVLKRAFNVAVDLEKLAMNPTAKVPLPHAASASYERHSSQREAQKRASRLRCASRAGAGKWRCTCYIFGYEVGTKLLQSPPTLVYALTMPSVGNR
jgi:Phage integrase, N-terminal SAM-like domain